MGVSEVQVFVSLAVVLGAAFVALVCVFLQSSNGRLRESNIELRARQDERNKLERQLALQGRRKKRPVAVAERRGRLRRRAEKPVRAENYMMILNVRDEAQQDAVEFEQDPQGPPWQEEPGEVVRIRVLEDGEVIKEGENAKVVTAPCDLTIPARIQEPAALARLLAEDRPFHGLAVVLSLVDYPRLTMEQDESAMRKLMASISSLVLSLAKEPDFCCRIAEDEFVLVMAHETGASAKRRIQLIAESLWDFQLGSMGSNPIVFSWGAVESDGRSLMPVLKEAREQMLETRRTRRSYQARAKTLATV